MFDLNKKWILHIDRIFVHRASWSLHKLYLTAVYSILNFFSYLNLSKIKNILNLFSFTNAPNHLIIYKVYPCHRKPKLKNRTEQTTFHFSSYSFSESVSPLSQISPCIYTHLYVHIYTYINYSVFCIYCAIIIQIQLIR